MIFSTRQSIARHNLLQLVAATATTIVVSVSFCAAQGAVDYTGTGGTHTIQGRIYFPSGRSADAPGLNVKLESLTSGHLSLFTDTNGSFAFKNLTAGSYTIVIDGTDDYEAVREPVYIDDPGSTGLRGRTVVGNTPRKIVVPIYLIPKRSNRTKAGVLNAALASVPKAAMEFYASALEAASKDDHAKAVQQLNAAIAQYPDFPLALNALGVQYLKLGQADKAAQVLTKAVVLVPEEFEPRLNYGIALLNQNKFPEAEEQLKNAIGKNDEVPTAHMYLGIALMRVKKLDEAEKALLTAVRSKSPEVASAHRYLGGIYWARRDYKRAAEELELYLKLVPAASDAARTREAIKELKSKQ